LFLHHGQAKEGGARSQGVAQMRPHRLPPTSGRRSTLEPSGGSFARTQEKWLSPLPPPHRSPDIGMMVEMARQPPNLDNLMNEGIAFIINRFKSEIPKCPIGQRPVMIGRRKAAYDTVDKVMKRLDLIMN
ncbi:unnamed protein product, partial [Porites lobata]